MATREVRRPTVHSVQVDDSLWDWYKTHFEMKNPASRMREVLQEFAREQSRTGSPQLDLRVPGALGEGIKAGAVMPAKRDTSCEVCGVYIRQGTLVHYWKDEPGGPTHCRCARHKQEEDLA